MAWCWGRSTHCAIFGAQSSSVNCRMMFSRAGHACFMLSFQFITFREKPTACRVQHTRPMSINVTVMKLLLVPCGPGCSAPLQGSLLRAGPTILRPPHGSLTWVGPFQVVAKKAGCSHDIYSPFFLSNRLQDYSGLDMPSQEATVPSLLQHGVAGGCMQTCQVGSQEVCT